MRRIDESTHIDDTLVTCAEYQLFIDEMREQGQHCQPDHWISYQFPQGQARKPIVGVRLSDAKAFCEWLTKREQGRWFFRLPTLTEVDPYPLANPIQSPLGYWTVAPNLEAKFTWAGFTPINPRNIDIEKIRAIARDRDITIGPNSATGRNRDMTFVNDLENAIAHDIENPRALEVAPVLEIARAYILSRAFKRVLDIDRAEAIASTLDHAIVRVLDEERSNTINIALAFMLNRERDLHLFLDIYTLQERIAGRSPAFEGIRLVKERKQP